MEGQLHELDAHSGAPEGLMSIVREANPRHFTVYEVGLVQVGQREVERDSLANGRGFARGDEDPPHPELAGTVQHTMDLVEPRGRVRHRAKSQT